MTDDCDACENFAEEVDALRADLAALRAERDIQREVWARDLKDSSDRVFTLEIENEKARKDKEDLETALYRAKQLWYAAEAREAQARALLALWYRMEYMTPPEGVREGIVRDTRAFLDGRRDDACLCDEMGISVTCEKEGHPGRCPGCANRDTPHAPTCRNFHPARDEARGALTSRCNICDGEVFPSHFEKYPHHKP